MINGKLINIIIIIIIIIIMYLNGICHVPFDISDWMRIWNYKSQIVDVKKNIKLPANMLGAASYHNFPLLTTILPFSPTLPHTDFGHCNKQMWTVYPHILMIC